MSVEPNQTKELFSLIHEIRDRTTRIEAETSRLNIIEKKADRAESKSNEALIKSNANEKDIEKVDSNIKWLWTTSIGSVGIGLTVVGIIIKLLG